MLKIIMQHKNINPKDGQCSVDDRDPGLETQKGPPKTQHKIVRLHFFLARLT